MKVNDHNPHSNQYGKRTEAIVTFDYKGYTIAICTNGTGSLEFDGAEQEYRITDALKQSWNGKGCVEDAITFIHNLESLKD